MAIAGLLVHTSKEDVNIIERTVSSIEEMTTHGIQEGQYVVVVVKSPVNDLEKVVGKINAIDGVLTIYTIFFSVEDEVDADDNLQEALH